MKVNNKLEYKDEIKSLSIIDFLHLCADNYKWFISSLITCLSIAVYYLVTTPNLYTMQSAVLVKQESQGNNVKSKSAQNEFNDIGIVQQAVNVNNVQRHLVSLNVVTEVVKRLHLDNNPNVLQTAVEIQKRLKASIDDEKSTIINLKYTDSSPKLAEKVLNSVVLVYNEQYLKDKNQVTSSTSQFIKERLKLLEKDLRGIDDSISTYKSKNKITDINSVSDVYLQQMNQSDTEIMRLSNQITIAEYILSILANKNNKHQLLPSNSGVDNQVLESQISQYNTMLLQLNNHLSYTSDQNPLIINQEKELSNLRSNIIHSIDNLIETFNIQLQTLQGYSGDATSKITSNPQQAKHLISIERQQKVKESLYMYLLQKLEENEISMTYISYNTQMIDQPHGSDEPSYPNNKSILIASIIIGLLIPGIFLFIKENLDNTVRDKTDIEHKLSIPLIGEVPFEEIDTKGKRKFPFFGSKTQEKSLVVKPFNHSLVNEAFRIIRSNLEFMTNESLNKDNIYIITSNYPDSGKTFISMNLAVTLAIKDKHVLFIDGDLRHASASRFWNSPNVGLSSYLGGKEKDINSLLLKSSDYPSLEILPVGVIPPNPTELLSSELLHELLEKMRPLYDYIFIDCPPAETLADASIIQKHSDRTLFIVRAGLFERSRISDLEADYQDGKHKHTSIILNCVKLGKRYGYKYGYGHKYGYHKKIRNSFFS